MRRNLLIVSESGQVRESLSTRLRREGYGVTVVGTSSEAVQVVRNVSVDVVLIEGAADSGAKRLREQILGERPGCRVMLVTSVGQSRSPADLMRYRAEDYLVAEDELLNVIRPRGGRSDDPRISPLAGKGIHALIQVVDVLVALLELDDRYFGGFSHQAMRLGRAVGEQMGVEEEVLYEVVLGTLLRDIGKAGIDLDILSEEGQLTEEQRAAMQEHASGSVMLLEHIDFPWKILPVIRHHHERYDGSGYPDGLKGREIPMGSRIVAVVDAYVAMVSDRSHRSARDPQEALDEIEQLAGSQFDPEVVEVFLKMMEDRLARGGSERPTVMLADPDPDFRRLMKMRLVNERFKVVTWNTVVKAGKKLFRKPPDLVLLGVDSEVSEAFQLLREVREHESLHSLPIVFLSRVNDRLLKVRALRQGADDFLLKTADAEEMAARIENITTREALRRAGRTGPVRRGITGQIGSMPLADIVQTLTIGMKTACVTLTAAGSEGQIWFREGQISHAVCNESQGEDAFFEMLRWKEGDFMIEHGVECETATIDNDPMFLVLEGLRRIDQESAGEMAAS